MGGGVKCFRRGDGRRAKTDVIPAQVSTLVIPAQASLIVIPAQVSALVIPAQAGIQSGGGLDPGFRRGRLWLSPGQALAFAGVTGFRRGRLWLSPG
jgi:hypothetical protein